MDVGQDFGGMQPSHEEGGASSEIAVKAGEPTTSQSQPAVQSQSDEQRMQQQVIGKAMKSRIQLYGGKLADSLHVGVSHVVVVPLPSLLPSVSAASTSVHECDGRGHWGDAAYKRMDDLQVSVVYAYVYEYVYVCIQL